MDVFWKPFDDRFSRLLGRLKTHQTTFSNGLQEALAGSMLEHYRKLAREISRNAQHRQEAANESIEKDRDEISA
jgi:DNA-binding transcriptional MocR family regulator